MKKTIRFINSMSDYREGRDPEETIDTSEIELIIFSSNPYYGKKGQIKGVDKYAQIRYKDGTLSRKFNYKLKEVMDVLGVKLKRVTFIPDERWCSIKSKTYKLPYSAYCLVGDKVYE
jgi:hypothetical protein